MEWKCWFFQNSSIQNPLEVFLCRNSQVNPMLHLKVCVCVCQIWGQESSTHHGWVNLVIVEASRIKSPWVTVSNNSPNIMSQETGQWGNRKFFELELSEIIVYNEPLCITFFFSCHKKNFLQLFCYFESTVAFVCSFIRKPENKQTNSGAYLQWRIKSTGWAGTVFISLDGGSLI